MNLVAGVDEVGRGCLAGPVVAAAAVFAPYTFLPRVTDSKRLSAMQREALVPRIQAHALHVGVGLCSPQEIDEMNILQASLEAMRRAVADLQLPADAPPAVILIDGNKAFPYPPNQTVAVVKGDLKSHTIAAASIIAKTTRDRLMHQLHEECPDYGWDTNVGYPTQAHYEGLAAHGATPYHRRSFKLHRS